jgi:ABC transporter substrate binding protein
MKNKITVLTLSALVFALCSLAAAQQPAKVFRIGYLSLRNTIEPHEEAFLKGLRDLGYIDGQNIIIEWRFAKGKAERFGDFAAELVRLKVDVIIAPGVQAVRAAKQSTTTIPIIFPTAGDAVASGLVASLARPGGNITGLTILSPELSGRGISPPFPCSRSARSASTWVIVQRNAYRRQVLGSKASIPGSPRCCRCGVRILGNEEGAG